MTDERKSWMDCPFCTDGVMEVTDSEGGITEIECTYCSGTGYRSFGKMSFVENIYPTYQILDATIAAEYNALSDANKATYSMILSCGTVDLSDGTSTKTKLWNIFGEGTTTRTNLEALIS